MAECVVARCVQERRFLKRELQKWGKNVLYLVGLERVAEEIMGREKWQKLAQPQMEFYSDEEVVDWKIDDTCCFCNNRKFSSSELAKGVYFGDDIDNPDQGYLYDVSRGSSPDADVDQPLDLSIGSRQRSHSPNSFNGEASSSSAFLKVPHIPDKSGKMKRRLDVTSNCKRSYTEDELQAALKDIRSGKLGTRRAAVIYGIPRSTLRNKVYKLALDRSSQDASRIKVTKDLSVEDLVGGENTGVSASESLRRLLRNRMAEKSGGGEDNKNVALDNQALQLFAGLDSNPTLAPFLAHVLANVHQLALASQSGNSGTGGGGGKDAENDLKLPLLPDLIRKLSGERFEEECNRQRSGVQNRGETSSVILKIPSYKPVKTVNNSDGGGGVGATGSSSSISSSGGGGGGGGAEATDVGSACISSSQSSSNNNGTKGIGVTLREIIAKSITQRASGKSATANKTSATAAQSASTATTNGSSSKKVHSEENKNSTTHPVTRSSHRVAAAAASQQQEKKEAIKKESSSLTKPEKRVRPKRGRYRNYDRDNLVEAVRAVQRGEMSVHRAGSFYGVPHSTLEYKVKERHLLRPRKHRGTSSTRTGKSTVVGSKNHHYVSSSSSVSNSCNNSNGSTASSTKITAASSGGGNTSKESPGGASSGGNLTTAGSALSNSTANNSANSTNNNSTSSLWPSSLFALDFSQLNSSNFFASQMMRKLQEDALMQGQGSDSSLSRDALLLGVLIRNGLQAAESAGNGK